MGGLVNCGVTAALRSFINKITQKYSVKLCVNVVTLIIKSHVLS